MRHILYANRGPMKNHLEHEFHNLYAEFQINPRTDFRDLYKSKYLKGARINYIMEAGDIISWHNLSRII